MPDKDIILALIALAGVIIGLIQFNKGQKSLKEREIKQRQFDALAKFKEMQAVKYREATEVISRIIYRSEYESVEFQELLNRFWQIYGVELPAVEDVEVEEAMKALGNIIEDIDFNDMGKYDKIVLKQFGLRVADQIQISSKNWVLPKEIKRAFFREGA